MKPRKGHKGRASGERRVHEGLVGERALIGKPYLADPTLRGGYERAIAPRTEAALGRVLARELPGDFRPRRVLDLGAGTGAAGRALRARFGGALDLVAVDRVAGPGVNVVADLGRGEVRPPGVAGRFDLIVAAHLLNELPLDVLGRARRVRAWAEVLLAPGGLVVLLEPALRKTSRELLAVRDALIADGFFVLAPCLTQAPCPALADPRDWCHDAAAVPGGSRVDFSYLVLAHDRPTPEVAGAPDLAQAAPLPFPPPFRLVSDLLDEKGRRRIWGCGRAGRLALIRLDRHRAPANAAFDDLTRGDVARLAGTEAASDGWRIVATTQVAAIRQRAKLAR